MPAYETLIYEAAESGVATIALNQPETRNALSPQLLAELLQALQHARDDEQVRVVVLASTHASVFSSGGNLAAFSSEVSQLDKHRENERFPELFALLGRARQALDLRRRRPCARRCARVGARLRPDRRARERPLRHAGDQRRPVPVHGRGAALPQRPAQEGGRTAAAGRADLGHGGRAHRHRQPRRPRRRLRSGRRRLGAQARRQVAADAEAWQGCDVQPSRTWPSPRRSSTCARSSRWRLQPRTCRRASPRSSRSASRSGRAADAPAVRVLRREVDDALVGRGPPRPARTHQARGRRGEDRPPARRREADRPRAARAADRRGHLGRARDPRPAALLSGRDGRSRRSCRRGRDRVRQGQRPPGRGRRPTTSR